MKRFLMHPLVLTFGLVLSLQIAVEARFAGGESVPVDRLIANVEKQVQQRPGDAEVVYTLGRLHSLAFAEGSKEVRIFRGNTPDARNQPPRFAPYSTPRVKPDDTLNQRKAQAFSHLHLAFHYYRRAIELAPKDALTQFSYGWMLEQGSAFATEVDAPFRSKPKKETEKAWREEALQAYRRAFALSKDEDAKLTHILDGASVIVSVEAGQSILDIYKYRSLSPMEQKEKTQIEAHLAHMKTIPRAISPLIFPIQRSQSLSSLMAAQTHVRFNLTGGATPHIWPWVTPDTGILVWDVRHTGQITSGRQLFGSVTWWMFWRNGYEPLAALDNNRSGWLEGSELRGIAVWQDKNSNGISEKGEVVPVEKFGIKRIAVQATSRREGALTNPQGVVMQDGSSRPLYDWTPTSLPSATN